MIELRHETMVVVADSEKALFFVNRTDGEDPYLDIVRKDYEENPPDREQTANNRGRQSESTGPRTYAYDETDFHELQKERFASDLADKLYKMAHQGRYESLVIVASPQVLGVVRAEMHKEVSDKLLAEIDKTLTNHPMPEIEKIVVDSLAQMDGRDAA